MSSPRREPVCMVDQDESSAFPSEDGILHEHCFTISNMKSHTTHTSSPVPHKGHFILLNLKSPDSNHTIQVPFQIDSVAYCNTLPSKHLSSMPWATVIPTRTVIIPMPAHQSTQSEKPPSKPARATPLAILHFRSLTLTNQHYSVQKPAKHLEYLPSTRFHQRMCHYHSTLPPDS